MITLFPGGKHYINGVNVGQPNYAPNTVNFGLVRIGTRIAKPTEFFNSLIDEVRNIIALLQK